MSVLCAVVASPPLTSGVRTLKALRLVGELLGVARLEVVNLLDVPTVDVNAMAVVGAEGGPWHSSRPAIKGGLEASDVWLAAWGMSPLTGPARGHRRAQIDWVVEQAAAHGHDHVWTVGPEPRHPSRWHQYVCDKHGRTEGVYDFGARLQQVLERQSSQRLSSRR